MQAHIVRLDSDRTHGYQVRFRTGRRRKSSYDSRLFSDKAVGGKRNAKRLATEYLRSLLAQEGITQWSAGRRTGMKYPENPKQTIASNASGRNGVYRGSHWISRGDRQRKVEYWAASYSIGADGRPTQRSRRFYVGAARTDRAAKRLAIRFREGWETAFLEEGARGVRRFFREWSTEESR